MLGSWPVSIIIGTILGFLSGLGIGGGSLLILWLTMVLGLPQAASRGVNLLFFLPSAAIACFFRWKQGAVPLRTVLPAAAAGCLAAIFGTALSLTLELGLLKKLFGGLLLLTGLRELLYRPKT